MSKGSETNVKLPEWLSKYYAGTAGRAENIADYFWQDLLPGGRIASSTPTKPPIKDKGPEYPELTEAEGGYLPGKSVAAEGTVTNPIDPTTGKLLPSGLGGYTGANEGGYLPAKAVAPEENAGTVRKKLPQLPPGGITDGGDPGDAAGGFDIGQILGYRPEVTPGLSPYQQLVGKYIPELAADPNQETMAGRLALEGMGSAERTPGVTADDPTIKALRDVFEGSTKELLKNEATMGGYNRGSAVPDVLAKNWMAQLAPALEAQMGRGERAIERGQRARETAIGQQTGAGAARTNRLLSALTMATEQGGLERGVEKEKAAAAQAEKLRLAALAEQSVMGPMGLLPSSIGSKTGKAK